jgi:UDP-N-acetylglucosamine acyltransferase
VGNNIHPTAIVADGAELGADVEIGPYSVIDDHVKIGDGTQIGANVRILENTTIGKKCEIHYGAVVGGVPQDKKFHGEKTETIIGNENVIREYVTINRGTEGGGAKTVLGDRNLIMSYVHIAHDCILANDIILASYTALTGHVVVDDFAATSGMVGIHHFCRIGKMAYVGGMSKVTQDVPPYVTADGNPCRNRALNLVGLRRNALSPGAIAALKEAYRVLFMDKRGNLSDVIESFKESEEYSFDEVKHLVKFIEERSLNTKARYLENFRGGKS